jgi:hypothetical protein
MRMVEGDLTEVCVDTSDVRLGTCKGPVSILPPTIHTHHF